MQIQKKSKKELKNTTEYKEWKENLNAHYAELINELKENLVDKFIKAKQVQLPDYPIFMAIAEEIGYDATGKKTNLNELDVIGKELKDFILNIENA